MSNMLIYVYQICPHALWWSGSGKLSSVGGVLGRGSQGRKEIPSLQKRLEVGVGDTLKPAADATF